MEKMKKRGIAGTLKRGALGFFHDISTPVALMYYRKTLKIQPNRYLFYSQPSFSDNAYDLYCYLLEAEPDAEFVWWIQREDQLPKGNYPRTRFVYATSYDHAGYTIPALKEALQSRYLFFTHSSPLQNIGKSSGQIVVNLWHGCGYKDTTSRGASFYEQNRFDLALVPGKVFVKLKAGFWGCPEELVQPLGYPRYDRMLHPSKQGEAFLKRLHPENKKVLWLPTFRQSTRTRTPEMDIRYDYDLPLLSGKDQLHQLDEYCKEHGVDLYLKRHPLQKNYRDEKEPLGNIFFLTGEDLKNEGISLYDLYPYSDALISDYSSAAIDYLLLDKPLAFSLDDFEAYGASRGFTFSDPLSYMPGHHLYRYEDLLMFLKDIGENRDPYRNERKGIFDEVHNPAEGYCDRIWKKIKEIQAE